MTPASVHLLICLSVSVSTFDPGTLPTGKNTFVKTIFDGRCSTWVQSIHANHHKKTREAVDANDTRRLQELKCNAPILVPIPVATG